MGDLTAASPSDSLQELAEEVRGLRDLFRRRLMEDKAKAAMYEKLYEQLEFAREGLRRQVVQPIAEELILVIDRVEARPEPDEFALSLRDELVEVLARRNVTPIPDTPNFDASLHQAVGVDEQSAEPAGTVTARVRRGWLSGNTVVRPQQVGVSAGEAPDG